MEKKCSHSKYTCTTKMVIVKMKELGSEVDQMVMLVSVICADCRRSFVIKAQPGFSTFEPTQDALGTQLRIPVEFPYDEDNDTDDDELQVNQNPPEGIMH